MYSLTDPRHDAWRFDPHCGGGGNYLYYWQDENWLCTKHREINVAASSPQSLPRLFFFSLLIYLFIFFIFLPNAAQCRVSEEEEQAGHKKGGLVGDRGWQGWGEQTNSSTDWLGMEGRMRAVDRRSDSAKIHNLPTAQSRERGRGCFFNLITGSKCLIPNIDTGNRPREKLMKNWSKSTKFKEHWVFRVQDGHHRLIKPCASELNLPTERLPPLLHPPALYLEHWHYIRHLTATSTRRDSFRRWEEYESSRTLNFWVLLSFNLLQTNIFDKNTAPHATLNIKENVS